MIDGLSLDSRQSVGVVGGIVPLIILAVVVALILHRRRQARVQPHVQATTEYYGGQPRSPTLASFGSNPPPPVYYVSFPYNCVHLVRSV